MLTNFQILFVINEVQVESRQDVKHTVVTPVCHRI